MRSFQKYYALIKSHTFLLTVFRVFVVRCLGISSLFLLNLLISRHYSPQEAGIFFWILNIIMMLGSISTLGNNEYLIKTVGANFKSHNWDNVNIAFSRGLYLTIGANIFFICLFTVFGNYLAINIFGKNELAEYMSWIAVGVFFYSVILIFSSSIQGRNEPVSASLVQNSLTPIIFLLIMAFIIASGASITIYNCFFIYLSALFFASFAGLTVWFKNRHSKLILNPGIGELEYRSTTCNLWLINIMGLLIQWGSMSISVLFLTTGEIAHYAVAYRVGSIMTFLLVAVNFVVAPQFSRASSNNDMDQIKKTAVESCFWLTVCSIPLFTLLFLFAKTVLSLFGPEYTSSVYVLRIILIGQLINVMSGSVGYIFTMTGYENIFRNILIFSGIFSFLITFILISFFGIIGCAVAFSISISFHNILSAWFVRKKLNFWVYDIYRNRLSLKHLFYRKR